MKKKLFLPSQLLKTNDQRRKHSTRILMIGFRVDETEFKTITSKARSMGQKTAAYCRECALNHKIVDKSEETRRFRISIIRSLNNLNQIAAHFNRAGLDTQGLMEIKTLLQELKNDLNNGK